MDNQPSLRQFSVYRAELPNLGENHIIIAGVDVTAREDWGVPIDTVEGMTPRDALQIYLNRACLKMPFGGMRSMGSNAFYITLKKEG